MYTLPEAVQHARPFGAAVIGARGWQEHLFKSNLAVCPLALHQPKEAARIAANDKVAPNPLTGGHVREQLRKAQKENDDLKCVGAKKSLLLGNQDVEDTLGKYRIFKPTSTCSVFEKMVPSRKT